MKDPCIEWIPPRFKEKYRRYYVNHEIIERSDLKKIERLLIRSFRYAILRYYMLKGYRIPREVLENPEKYGPTPAIIWLYIVNPHEFIALIGDSSIPRKEDKIASVFIQEYTTKIQKLGLEVIYIDLLDFSSKYDWGDAQRMLYLRLRKTSAE